MELVFIFDIAVYMHDLLPVVGGHVWLIAVKNSLVLRDEWPPLGLLVDSGGD